MKDNGAFLLLASNRPEAIDQALLRNGRCDFKIKLNRPSMESVQLILRHHLGRVPIGEDTSLDELVMYATESIADPSRIILEAAAIDWDGKRLKARKGSTRAFTFENILSGAMVVSIPERAKRLAFVRDRDSGKFTGVSVQDILDAVNAVYQENLLIDHTYALNEFKKEYEEWISSSSKE